MREEVESTGHDSSVRGGFLSEDLYHQNVSRLGVGLPQVGQRIVTRKGPLEVEEVVDLGKDDRGNWGFNVKGRLVER